VGSGVGVSITSGIGVTTQRVAVGVAEGFLVGLGVDVGVKLGLAVLFGFRVGVRVKKGVLVNSVGGIAEGVGDVVALIGALQAETNRLKARAIPSPIISEKGDFFVFIRE
jgi:hypothetical protein